MTPERWQQVKELFDAALELDASQRAAFLDQACAGDPGLRRQVEALIASHEGAPRFLEEPALEVAAQMIAQEQAHSPVRQTIGPFKIVKRLGAGGMGEVYLAEDTRLGRQVALKLLPDYFTTAQERVRRFQQEARAASALSHPNVATIYEIGEAEGTTYIAMEYVEGQTLDAKIGGQLLETGEILDIAVQVADALEEAHTKGIIHRDIKPGNVMVTARGQVKVLDFGLAKMTRQEREGLASDLSTQVRTQPGLLMGTLAYMSPEQALGHEVDHRTDIFSLGVVLYEMATGRRPFGGTTTGEILDQIIHAEPEAIARFNENAPAELERIIGKCLEKDREQRYQSAGELLVDLRNLKRVVESGAATVAVASKVRGRRLLRSRQTLALAAVVVLAVAALIYALLFRGAPTAVAPETAPTAVSPEIKLVAVLPLENLSGDPAQEYFADGMTEALINNLARIRALKVISRTSAMRYKGSQKSLPEIARELNVDAVLEGSVQRSGGRVRVTAQLIHAATDAHLWARDYERDLTDVLKLQSEIARTVAAEIRIQVTAEERARLASVRRVNPQAHEAYLLGRYHFSKDNETAFRHAIKYFERAIEIEPNYAAAYVGLSNATVFLGLVGAEDLRELESPARAASLKAIELDDQLADAYLSLARIKQNYDWDWAGAETEIRRALELDPGGIDVHTDYGYLLMHLGRLDEAIREGEIAVQLDPVSSLTRSALGRFYYRAHRYEEALRHLQRAVELEPRSAHANYRLADLYAQVGKYAEAIAAYERARDASPKGGNPQAAIARVYALMGKHREARQMIHGLRAAPHVLASVYAALGDKDEALRILEKTVAEREFATPLKAEPPLESLYSDPRYQALLRRMNLPPE